MVMPYGRFRYRVERTRIVPATAMWVTRKVGHDRLVLTACHPLYSAAQRVVVFARLVDSQARGIDGLSRGVSRAYPTRVAYGLPAVASGPDPIDAARERDDASRMVTTLVRNTESALRPGSPAAGSAALQRDGDRRRAGRRAAVRAGDYVVDADAVAAALLGPARPPARRRDW